MTKSDQIRAEFFARRRRSDAARGLPVRCIAREVADGCTPAGDRFGEATFYLATLVGGFVGILLALMLAGVLR